MHESGLIGREAETAELKSAIRSVTTAARSGVVIIEGEPGIGKTRLLEMGMDLARRSGLRVFGGRADEVAGAKPFGPLVQAFACRRDAEGSSRRRIAEMLRRGGDEGSMYRICDAFMDLVAQEAAEAPFVLTIDDLQWADDGSVLVLQSLIGHHQPLPILVFATARPPPRAKPLAKFMSAVAAGRGTLVKVGPLGESDVLAVVEQLVGAAPGARLSAAVTRSGGNPLLVTEFVTTLMRQGDVVLEGALADTSASATPPALADLVGARLADLSEPAQWAVRHAALLGSVFSAADLAVVLDLDSPSLAVQLVEAVDSGLLEDHPDGLHFRHDLIREALQNTIPGSVRRRMHHDIGLKLDAAGAHPLNVGNHLLLGAEHADDRTIRGLLAAAAAAEAGQPALAVAFLEKALELLRPGDDRRLETLVAIAGPLRWVGRVGDSVSRVREALGLSPPPDLEMRLWDQLFRTLPVGGGLPGEDFPFTEVRALLARPELPDRWRAAFHVRHASFCEIVADYETGASEAETAIALAVRLRDLGTQAEAWCVLGINLAKARRRERVADAFRRAEAAARAQLAAAPDSMSAVTRLAYVLGRAGYFSGSSRSAELLDEAKGLLHRAGAVPELAAVHDALGQRRFRDLQWREALAEWGEHERVQNILDVHVWIQVYMLRSYILLHSGDINGAREQVALAKQGWRPDPPFVNANPFLTEAVIEAAADAATGLMLLEKAFDLSPGLGIYGEAARDAARLAMDAGRQDLLEMLAEQARKRFGWDQWYGALLDQNPQPLIEMNPSEMSPLSRAWLNDDIGMLLVRRNSEQEAVPWLNQALAAYEAADARRDVARIKSMLRSAGVRSTSRSSGRRPVSGWESLTPAELAVVELAAEGLTNPQIAERLFVSKRTVQTHLTHVYSKLSISSRVELAALASRSR